MDDRDARSAMPDVRGLTDTVFGVAMTLIVYEVRMPSGEDVASGWQVAVRAILPQMATLALGFFIGAFFWTSQRRRLQVAQVATRLQLFLNLTFLLLVVMLPLSAKAYGTFGPTNVVVVLASAHFTAVAALNLGLWWMALRRVGAPGLPPEWRYMVAPGSALAVLGCALLLAPYAPWAASRLWFGAFLIPLVDALANPQPRPVPGR